jgi:hypothetical protein
MKKILPQLGYVCFLEVVPLSKLFCVCLSLEKLVNRKHFPVKENLACFLGKCFPEKFGRKIFFWKL